MNTTVLGILTILAAIINAAISFIKTGAADWGVTVAAVTAGIGLIKAKDAPSSGTFQCNGLVTILALALAIVGLASCQVITAPDGTRVQKVDADAVNQGVGVIERLTDLFKPTETPAVIPAK